MFQQLQNKFNNNYNPTNINNEFIPDENWQEVEEIDDKIQQNGDK